MRDKTSGVWGLQAGPPGSLNLRWLVMLCPFFLKPFGTSVLVMPLVYIIELDFAEICLYRRHTFE